MDTIPLATERTELLAVLVKFDCVETRVGACAYSTDLLVYNLPYKFGRLCMCVYVATVNKWLLPHSW